MMAPSRHMACQTCRERKVRCDGGQPCCKTCKQHGEKCVYVQSVQQSKSDLLNKIDNLQERLAQAEAKLNTPSSVSSHFLYGSGVPFIPMPSLSSIETSLPQSLHMDISQQPLTPEASLRDAPGSEATIPSPDELAGIWSSFTSGLGHGTAEETSLSLPRTLSFPTLTSEQAVPDAGKVTTDSVQFETRPRSPCLPTIRAIRALNGQHGVAQPPDDGGVVLSELVNFVSAIFANQGHIAGITSVVAEYLAWARRTPDINYAQILEILEARLRETADLANTKHWVEFQNLQASVGKSETYKWKLGALERGLKATEAEISTFFSTSYDIRSALELQRQL